MNEYTNYINKNNNIINYLQKSIEKHKKDKENLQNKMNKLNIPDENIENLKNKLKKLEQENATKDENIQKYEKMFEEVIQNVGTTDEIRTDVLKRMFKQISNYKSQIDKLLESKDNMETYYQNEIKTLKEISEFLTSDNTKLKTENENQANETSEIQKFNELGSQEYSLFKETLKSILDIGNQIPEFDKITEEIKNIRNELLSDEMLKTKEIIKSQNKEIKELKENIYDNTNRSSMKSQKSNTLNKKKNGNELVQIMKNIKLKVKIYTALVNKKLKEVNGMEEHIKLIKNYNTFSKKCGENQELLCEENKIMTDEMINDFNGLNQFEQELKGEVDLLNKKLESNKDHHENNLLIINNNVNLQLNNIKERESFIVKQSEQITDTLKKVANQKQNAVELLKRENQQLKNRNYVMTTKL